jgi:hypothetical protein
VHQVAARLEKLMLDQQVIHLKKNRLHQHRSRRLSSHSGVEPPGSYQGATEDGTGELPGSAAPGSPSQGAPAIVVLAPITDPLAQERGRHSCTQEDRDQDGEYAPMRRERPPVSRPGPDRHTKLGVPATKPNYRQCPRLIGHRV